MGAEISPLPIGTVLDTCYVVIAEDPERGDHTIVRGELLYSKELVAQKAYNKWPDTAHRPWPQSNLEIKQLAETGVLEGDDWRLRLVPVSLVVVAEK